MNYIANNQILKANHNVPNVEVEFRKIIKLRIDFLITNHWSYVSGESI